MLVLLLISSLGLWCCWLRVFDQDLFAWDVRTERLSAMGHSQGLCFGNRVNVFMDGFRYFYDVGDASGI